jgi:hypothetical protein
MAKKPRKRTNPKDPAVSTFRALEDVIAQTEASIKEKTEKLQKGRKRGKGATR